MYVFCSSFFEMTLPSPHALNSTTSPISKTGIGGGFNNSFSNSIWFLAASIIVLAP